MKTRQSGKYGGNQQHRYQSKEDVIRALLQRESQGASLQIAAVKAKDDPLFAAAIRHFRIWREALRAAGIDPESVSGHREWTVQRVIDTIHALDCRGIQLNHRSAAQVDSGLLGAAFRLLGSWDKALRLAGYDPATIRIHRPPWTREQIIKLIRQRIAMDLPMSSCNVTPPSAASAAIRLFGSWQDALQAAAVPMPRGRYPTWTKVTVIEAILVRKKNGAPLHCFAIQKQASSLYNGACKYFGNWQRALIEAGIDPQTVRRRRTLWTRKEVIEQLHRRRGMVLDVRRCACYPDALVFAARRLFGGWRKALEAAGIEPLTFPPTRPVVLKEDNGSSRSRRPRRKKQACRGPMRHYRSKEEVTRAIQQRQSQGAALYAVAVRADDLGLHLAAMRYMRDWNDALRAAGIDPETVGAKRLWSPERVLHEIQQLAHNGVALNANSIVKIDQGLYQAAAKYWGSWDKALSAAGLDVSSIRMTRPNWTKPQVIALIQAHAASGAPVLKTKIRPKSIYFAVDRLFGSFEEAVKAAGVTQQRNLPFRWSPAAVIEVIQERQRKGKALNSKAAIEDHSGLYGAARQYHGSWNQALRAAGIAPERVRVMPGRWTRERVIDQLCRCYHEGVDVRQAGYHPPALVKAGRHLFGSWPKTLRAAGITVSK